MARQKTRIFSVFGQIEEVVALAMIDEGHCRKIEQRDIPQTALFNAVGQKAKFAVVIPGELVNVFEKRCWDLLQ